MVALLVKLNRVLLLQLGQIASYYKGISIEQIDLETTGISNRNALFFIK